MRLKVSSAKWRPFCLGLNVLSRVSKRGSMVKQQMKWTGSSWTGAHWHINFHMMTSSNGKIFRVTGPLCGEFTGPDEFPTQRPVTRNFDVLFDPCLNKRLSKQA